MKNRRTRKGFAAVWYAAAMVAIVGMIGLAIDISYALWVAQQLQSTADSAALAAAQYVQQDIALARQCAVNFGQQNSVATEIVLLRSNDNNSPEGDVVVGRYDRETGQFTPTTQSPNAVKVTVRKTSSSLNGAAMLFFGQMFGVNSVDVERSAIAMVANGTGAGLIALNEKKPNSFYALGSPVVTVEGGAIQVDSRSLSAARLQGSAHVIAPDMNIVGDITFVGNATFSGNLHTGTRKIGDPLKHLPPPTWNPADDLGEIRINNGTHTISPGYYSEGMRFKGGNITLLPGIYILDGTGLDVGGNTRLTARNVMFYIIGSGKLDMTGNGSIVVTPPDPTEEAFPDADIYEGISIFQDRRNVGSARIIGTSLLDLDGTLYFPSNVVSISGTGDGFGQQLITDMVHISGNGEITIRYDGRNSGPGLRVWLVK